MSYHDKETVPIDTLYLTWAQYSMHALYKAPYSAYTTHTMYDVYTTKYAQDMYYI